MARLSDVIEEFIKDMIKETGGEAEIQRNALATRFKCVPSQINYVIGTRFTNEHGYFVESRRGGGGHIKIRRIAVTKPYNNFMHLVLSIGDSISEQSAVAHINNFVDYKLISSRDGKLMKAAISSKALSSASPDERDAIRAGILKNMLLRLIVD
ncbi:MAG: CtsR family transcriptional regulator [Clostridia bacterium]|jgi:transcriptional regulator CtsR|nr:CtsR family transcriptional regulator [Clostridia bacterium]